MDKCNSVLSKLDADFDSYWDYEAKNKNRNRIRVGRQYQASVPPLLKPGEKDGRKSEDLETLKWNPNKLNDQEVEQYLSMAKGISLFAKAVDSSRVPEKPDNTLQSAVKGLSEFVASHHPCHHDDGCQVPNPAPGEPMAKVSLSNDFTPSEAHVFAQALEACGKNFCAIKKEYLPWKPVRSIIEYYYQGKNDKPESPSQTPPDDLVKKEPEPVASCSHISEKEEEKINVVDVDNKKELATFLANDAGNDLKPQLKESDDSASSTVGSLKFFLGGRLVLKLNAQQDSGTKCQWVQSNELPKHGSLNKKVKHKKKSIQDGFAPAPLCESPKHSSKKRTDDVPTSKNPSDNSDTPVKKLKLKSEYDFSDVHSATLCSVSWTPPVADGRESVDAEDNSSKTSEGYTSPILSRNVKVELSGNDSNEQKCDGWVKSESERNSFGGDDQEVLSQKSALCGGAKSGPKSSGYRVPHASSPKQWNKWSNSSGSRTMPSSPSPALSTDSKSSVRESPLDLTASKLESPGSSSCTQCSSPKSSYRKSLVKTECSDISMPSKCEMQQPNRSDDVSQKSSICDAAESDNSKEESMDAVTDNHKSSPDNQEEGSLPMPYSFCNVPYPCALPKCAKDYSLDDHMCDKANVEKKQLGDQQEYIMHEDDICKKNAAWCGESMAPYLQYYPQCYPYYVAYGVAPSPVPESAVTEMPLDLSSSDGVKDKSATAAVENLPEDVKTSAQENAEERGMLYQLLKNKNGK